MRYALAMILALVPGVAAAETCPPAPDPVLGLAFESRYSDTDANRATLDQDRADAAKAELAPMDEFIRILSDGLEAALNATDPDRAQAADCLLRQMQHWAQADALSAQGTETVQLTIGSRLAAFAMITHVAVLMAPDSRSIDDVRDWLVRRMVEQMVFWETAPDRASQNNLRAWAALAGTLTAGLSGDPVMRGWAAWSVTYVMCSAATDGSLPQEMRRGAYALHYQLHALSALVPAVLHLREQGIDLTNRCDHAIERAVTFALSDLTDGSLSAALAGQDQSYFNGQDELEGWQLAFLKPYEKLVNNYSVKEIENKFAPLSNSKLGGDQSLIYEYVFP